MLGTHTAPDVFFLKGLVAPSYMSFDILAPLDEYAQPDDLKDFFPPLLDAFKRNGKLYGLPKDFNPYVLFYSKSALQGFYGKCRVRQAVSSTI